MEHATLEDLIEYFAGDMDDSHEEALEVHLSDCDQCAELACKVGSISKTTEATVDEWTAASHAAAVAARSMMSNDAGLAWGGVPSGERIGDSYAPRGCGPHLNLWPKREATS